MSTFVGIDQSYSGTGIVVIRNGDVILTKELVCKPKDYDSIREVSSQINKIVTSHEAELVGIEGYSFGSQGRLADLGELGGIIRYRMFLKYIHFFVVPPNTWKKSIVGLGKAKKQLIIKEVYKRYAFEHTSDNVVDAYCIAKFAHMLHAIRQKSRLDRTIEEKSLLKKVEWFARQI